MKIIHHNTRDYLEIKQDKQILFAFCNKVDTELIMLSYWMNCRDFFTDVLNAEEQQRSIEAYDFVYDGANTHIDRDKTRFLIKVMDESDQADIEKNISILRNIEVQNGLALTSITKIKKLHYLVEGDPFWLNTTFSLHLYTFLIKVLGHPIESLENWFENLKQQGTNEAKYARGFQEGFLKALGNLRAVFDNPTTVHGYGGLEEDQTIIDYFIHNSGGVSTLFNPAAEHINTLKNNKYYKRLVKVLK